VYSQFADSAERRAENPKMPMPTMQLTFLLQFKLHKKATGAKGLPLLTLLLLYFNTINLTNPDRGQRL
jgi:hypothetical protein